MTLKFKNSLSAIDFGDSFYLFKSEIKAAEFLLCNHCIEHKLLREKER